MGRVQIQAGPKPRPKRKALDTGIVVPTSGVVDQGVVGGRSPSSIETPATVSGTPVAATAFRAASSLMSPGQREEVSKTGKPSPLHMPANPLDVPQTFPGPRTPRRQQATSATGTSTASSSSLSYVEGLSAGMEFREGLPETVLGSGGGNTAASGRGRKRAAEPSEPKNLRPRRVKAKTSA